MNPELNREYPDPGEAKLIEAMVKVVAKWMKPSRGAHDAASVPNKFQ